MMDNQTAKSIDRSLKSIARSLEKMTARNNPQPMDFKIGLPISEDAAAQSIADRAMDDMSKRLTKELFASPFREGSQ